ncbi:succinate dehydrogenase/fumarate reductase-like Fe-S protein [Sporomusaceae bacterium BoRhaA]|nr:succinate dehydrogenase/fumarate reductase-like Fe-S protein [Pelorhabdus rhamnosifermentans]
MNSMPTLACTYTVGDVRELLLEPKNSNIVRDLVAL